jgi:hypothetical protein
MAEVLEYLVLVRHGGGTRVLVLVIMVEVLEYLLASMAEVLEYLLLTC